MIIRDGFLQLFPSLRLEDVEADEDNDMVSKAFSSFGGRDSFRFFMAVSVLTFDILNDESFLGVHRFRCPDRRPRINQSCWVPARLICNGTEWADDIRDCPTPNSGYEAGLGSSSDDVCEKSSLSTNISELLVSSSWDGDEIIASCVWPAHYRRAKSVPKYLFRQQKSPVSLLTENQWLLLFPLPLWVATMDTQTIHLMIDSEWTTNPFTGPTPLRYRECHSVTFGLKGLVVVYAYVHTVYW